VLQSAAAAAAAGQVPRRYGSEPKGSAQPQQPAQQHKRQPFRLTVPRFGL